MKISNKVIIATLAIVFMSSFSINVLHAATAPNLGSADGYAIFGKAGVTNTVASTHIWGNVGADLLASITGLLAGQVDGTIIAPASGIQTAITSAYGNLAGQTSTGALDLAGNNIVTPGVYTVGATTLNGTLTLNGSGVYIFQSSSSISVSAGAQVILTNGASACNVFWQIPTSMTIGTGASMVGTIIADTALISLGTNATLQGRALSSIAQVTLDNNQITEPTCTASPVVVPVAPVVSTPVVSTTEVTTPAEVVAPVVVPVVAPVVLPVAVPTLPRTGFPSQNTNISLVALLVSGILTATYSFYLVLKKN